MRLESVGTLHRVYVDGRLLVEADSSGPTHGRAALVTNNTQGEFDNVIVSPTLLTTMYATDFEAGTRGPWTFSGTGFWNLASAASTVLFQSSIAGDARNKLLDLPGVVEADVQVVWDPPWTPEKISPEGRALLSPGRHEPP